MVFGTEAPAIQQERCSRRAGLTRPYFNVRRRNLVIIGKVSVRRRIQTALDAL
jgi:hypothetical protein